MSNKNRAIVFENAPTDLTRRWVRLFVGFTVGTAVGLAPYLGILRVPLFSPLLSLYPVTLQPRLIPLSAALMGLAVVTVQWFAGERTRKARLRSYFFRVGIAAALGIAVLMLVRAAVVVDVPINAGADQVAFVVGWNRLPTCMCKEAADALCISQTLTLNPGQIEGCWGSRSVRFGELLLELNYLVVIGCMGALTGLIVVRGGSNTRRRHATRHTVA